MSAVNIGVDWRVFQHETTQLQGLSSSLEPLALRHRKLVAEMIMVRLFLLGENTIRSVCEKLLCGAIYLDGSCPNITVSASSKSNAETLIRVYHRTRPKHQLSWTQSREIRDNMRHTLGQGDPLFSVFLRNAAILTEMRYVRNHIVHNSSSSLRDFRTVVRAHYGGLKRGVTPGILLLTDALGAPPLVKRYIAYYRVLIRDLVRA